MKLDRKALLLYAITDRSWTYTMSLFDQIEEALTGGATCIQLREKELSDDDFYSEALVIRGLCDIFKVPLIINDNVNIAIRCKANGIHIGQDDMNIQEVRELVGPDMTIGISAHSVEEALEAEKNGADYLGVGAVFGTSTKPDAKPLEFETLKDICNSVSIPVVAIGGITRYNIFDLEGSGISGVALASAIFSSSDIEYECGKLRKELKKIRF